MQKVALIVAGGKGKRMASSIPKQFLLLKSLPILMHTLKQFSHFNETILVLPQSQFDCWKELCNKKKFTQPHTLVAGGKNRFQSVRYGLERTKKNTVVAIHDGVRPLVSKVLIDSLITKPEEGVGVIPVLPIKDSIRKIEGENSRSIDRDALYIVQTPQCFISVDIQKAYSQKFCKQFTDDASVFESNGGKIKTILGEEKNLKITTKEDLLFAELFKQ